MHPVDEDLKKLLKATASVNGEESRAASFTLAKALELPLRKGVMSGNIRDGIFEEIPFDWGVQPEFPLDFLTPGTEDRFIGYTVPSHGALPEAQIQSDYVTVPTYEVGNSITWLQKYARHARWDVFSRAMEVLEMGLVKKLNDDAFHVLLAAAIDRNIGVYDSAAAQGQFTKRLVNLAKIAMRRNGGGNSSSVNRGKLTNVFLSPEAMEDMRDWGVDQADDVTRREIYVAGDDTLRKVFGVVLHDTDEFGVDQQYQQYFTGVLSATLPTAGGHTDVEFMLGLDLSKKDSFVMPTRGGMESVPYLTLKEHRRDGMQVFMEVGFAVLDGRRAILMSC